MADLSLVTDNYFTIASETFADNLSASIAAGAATVPVNNNSEYTNGDCVVLTVDPGTVNEATFIGKKSGLNFIECIWTEGNTAVGHSNGATIIDYDSATHHNAQTKGIQQFANDDGTLKTQPVRDALGLGATAANGWEVSPYTYSVSSGYNKGNREFDLTVANADLTTVYSAGQRLRLTRGTTPGTQCADFELSSSQYASRAIGSIAGPLATITDDMTAEAWVKQESTTGTQSIISKFSAAGTSGWRLDLVDGKPQIMGMNAGNIDNCLSTMAIPLATWTHIAGTLDMSASTGVLYVNGISLPVVYTNGAATAWTNVANDLAIGGMTAGSLFFDGKISDVRLWNVIRTQTQIRDNMYQQLVGTETNLIGYWKLAGDFNDSTSNANHLTANGGVVATSVDNPFNAIEYAIIVKVTYSAPNTTVTVVTSNKGGIPNQTLSAPYYSAQKTPYGFPASKNAWTIKLLNVTQLSQAAVVGTWYNMGSTQLVVPTGSWIVGYLIDGQTNSTNTDATWYTTFSTSNSAESDREFTQHNELSSTATVNSISISTGKFKDVETTTQTPYYFLMKAQSANDTLYIRGDNTTSIFYAENAYV